MRYEYSCPKCKTTVEIDKRLNDETVPLCCQEGCDGIEMQKLISVSSFHLKGGGWYKDGYSK